MRLQHLLFILVSLLRLASVFANSSDAPKSVPPGSDAVPELNTRFLSTPADEKKSQKDFKPKAVVVPKTDKEIGWPTKDASLEGKNNSAN